MGWWWWCWRCTHHHCVGLWYLTDDVNICVNLILIFTLNSTFYLCGEGMAAWVKASRPHICLDINLPEGFTLITSPFSHFLFELFYQLIGSFSLFSRMKWKLVHEFQHSFHRWPATQIRFQQQQIRMRSHHRLQLEWVSTTTTTTAKKGGKNTITTTHT